MAWRPRSEAPHDHSRALAEKAAALGHEGGLRVLHELGGEAAASVAAANVHGCTPAHVAAVYGQEGCLRVLHELGGNAADSLAASAADGRTPAHYAADKGHEGCLRVLHELGGAAAASLAAAATKTGEDKLPSVMLISRSELVRCVLRVSSLLCHYAHHVYTCCGFTLRCTLR